MDEQRIRDLAPEDVRRALTPALIAGLTADQTRAFLVHHREHIMNESAPVPASSSLQRASGSLLGGSQSQGATVEPAQTTPANLKRQGWKLKGVVAALTAAEALAAGFTHEDYAAAHEKHAAAPELDATATQAAESGVTGD